MSARPNPVHLDDETFELLASRALDGDLSAVEQTEFEKYLAQNSEARQRFIQLKSLVEEFRALPSPEPAFALATRVAARVQDHAQGFGGVLLRFGVFRKMAPVFGLMVAVSLVAVYTLTDTRSAPVQTASRTETAKRFVPEKDVDGPVQVFFEQADSAPKVNADGGLVASRNESKPSRADASSAVPAAPAIPAEKLAELTVQAPAAHAPSEFQEKDAAATAAAALAAAPAPPSAPAQLGAQVAAEKGMAREGAARDLSSSTSADFAPEMKLAKAKEEASAARGQAGADKKAAPSVALGGAVKKQNPSLSITGNPGWRIVKEPHPGAFPEGVKASYRLKLDESGNVIGVTRVKISDPEAAGQVEAVLKTLALSRSGSTEASSEIEIRIGPD